MDVKPGQVYINSGSGSSVRVTEVDHGYYLGPSARVETLEGKRGRWVSLRKFHTSADRKTGYRLLNGTEGQQ